MSVSNQTAINTASNSSVYFWLCMISVKGNIFINVLIKSSCLKKVDKLSIYTKTPTYIIF